MSLFGPGSGFLAAMEREVEGMKADLLASLDKQLYGFTDFTGLAGLAGLAAEPDPLDDILADAGVKERPPRYRFGSMTLPADREPRPSPEWVPCDACGVPIARSDYGFWMDRDYKSACDGCLIPTDRHPGPPIRLAHTPRSGYIDHPDDDGPAPGVVARVQWYGERLGGNRLPTLTDLDDA